MNIQGGHGHHVQPPGGPPPPPQVASSSPNDPVLSFEDFTAMSPFLDQAALHLATSANPYAASAASAASLAAQASSGKTNVTLTSAAIGDKIRLIIRQGRRGSEEHG